MGLLVPFQSIPVASPNALADPEPRRSVVRAAPWLLLTLFVLCLLPRALMALKISSVCPDGVLYIQLAKSLEQGNLQGGLQEMRLNTFPVLLLGLHRLGMDWELAAKVWGVLISSLTILPLFGLARRQFDDRTAIVACLLYAFHAKMIEWSPELIRDPTFWFLFTLALYLLWRAVSEVRLGFFALGGAAMVLALLTRVEGLFLLIPLLLWSGWRWFALRRGRGRLVLGVCLALFACPLLLLLINLTWLRHYPHWEISRLKPFEIAAVWFQSLGGQTPVVREGALSTFGPQVRMSTAELWWTFLHTAEQGLNAVFALLMFAGIWISRRVWLRRDQQALFYMALAIATGMWIHLWYIQISSHRYILPVVLIGSVFAAQSVLSLAGWLSRHARWFGLGDDCQGLATAALLLAVGGFATSEALASNYSFRAGEPQLGRWIQQRFGPSPNLLGSEGVTAVINYYAQGDCHLFPFTVTDPAILRMAQAYRPDVVLLQVTNHMRRMKTDRYKLLVDNMRELGLKPVEPSQLPPGCQRLLVLARDVDGRMARAPGAAQRTPARDTR